MSRISEKKNFSKMNIVFIAIIFYSYYFDSDDLPCVDICNSKNGKP